MPDIDALVHLVITRGSFVLVVIAVFLVLETAFFNANRWRRERRDINARLRILARSNDRQQALVEFRRLRGMTAAGEYRLPLLTLSRLVVQSGLTISFERLLMMMGAVTLAAGVLVYVLTSMALLAVMAAGATGLLAPLLVLMLSRARRLKLFEEQLPDAIDVMVRSLKAGHPAPVAVGIVAREMADPIGSEFGMVTDEMTYGLDLEAALANMRNRTGQPDLTLLLIAISIQTKTGGNLAEILSNLSRMMRERSRMRLKIRALSAEGRFSAIALSVIPVLIYLIVTMTSPSYYSDVNHDPMFAKAIYLALSLWLSGIYVMRRMVNFKF